MSDITHLRALVDGHSGYAELLPGRIGSIISAQRPAYLLQADKLKAGTGLPDELSRINVNWQANIESAASSVGRIEILRDQQESLMVGTCFRVGSNPRRVATAAHVAELLVEQRGELVPGPDPKPKPSRKKFRRAQAVFEATDSKPEERIDIEAIELLHYKWDLMLCRLAAPSQRAALQLADHSAIDTTVGVPICIIGYPAVPPDSNGEITLFNKLFSVDGEVRSGVKRASPGLIGPLPVTPEETDSIIQHDATTLRGSSGAPAISLENGTLMGLHFWGKDAGQSNLLIYLPAACEDPGLSERIDANAPVVAQHALGPWPDAPRRIGRALSSFALLQDASEAAGVNIKVRGMPMSISDAPAVLADRRDLRDRFYTPSLRDPLPKKVPDVWPDERIRRQMGDECTGHALASAIDRQLEKQKRGIQGGVSARMLYEMGRLHDEFVDDQPGGTSLRGAIKGFFHHGVCPQQVSAAMSSPNWLLNVEMAKAARSTSLGAYYRLRDSLPDFQMAIQEAGAVLVSAWLHSGWRKPKKGLIEQRPERRAAHAFVLVGYDSDGFIIQNSWGPEWGNFEQRPGFAHWSYADWAANVIDAWVLQLAPSAPKAHNLPLRSYVTDNAQTISRLDIEFAALPEPRRMAIIGHIAHAERTGLIDAGLTGVGQHALRETALYLSTKDVWDEKKYKSLAFIFHDPFIGTEAAARLAAHMIPRFKAANVYAINIVYGADEVRSLTARMREEAEFSRAVSGDSGENLTAYLERRAQVVGKPLFDAYLEGIKEAAQPGGSLWRILASFYLEALQRPGGAGKPRRLHALAFGAGAQTARAIFCGPDTKSLNNLVKMKALTLDSVSLIAPVTGRL